MSIRIFVTGGTFDKEYDEINGTLFFKESHIHELLQLGRCQLACEVDTLMLKDSLEMTSEDRTNIIEHCKNAVEKCIVITHGTDTMTDTARELAAAMSNQEMAKKTIVITGAMIPYAFGSSDGLFNLGSALSFVQTLSHGVYIAMNGKVFDWDNVKKNRALGRFETLQP
ncbi:MAG: asparaginase domain-containing protein [Pseudomonadota bacterium]